MSNYDEEPTFDDETPPEEEEGSNRTFLIAAGVLGGLVLLGLLCAAGYIFFTRSNTQSAEATAYLAATNQQATIQVGLTQKAVSNAAAQALTLTAAPTNTLPPTSTPVIAQATSTQVEALLNPADVATLAAGLTKSASSQSNSAATAAAGQTQMASSQSNATATVAAGSTQLAASTQDPAVVGTIAAGLTQLASAQNNLAATSAVNLTQAALIQTSEAATITVGLTQLASANLTQSPATATIAAGLTQLAMSTQTVIATSTALPQTGFADQAGIPGLLLMAIALVVVIFLVRRLRSTPAK